MYLYGMLNVSQKIKVAASHLLRSQIELDLEDYGLKSLSDLCNKILASYAEFTPPDPSKIGTDDTLYKNVAPMHLFDGEKNFNPHYMHLQISKKYDFLVLNENLRYVDYQEQGMSASILKQYKNSPNSFLETRRLYLNIDQAPIKFKIKKFK